MIRPLLFLCLIGLYLNTNAQVYRSRAYYTQHGLPSNIISGIAQDKDGLIWFLTSKGVVKYDGTQWHTLEDSLELPLVWLSNMSITPDGTVYIGGYHKNTYRISRIGDGFCDHVIPDFDKIPLSSTRSFAAGPNSEEIAVASYHHLGIYNYSSGAWKMHEKPGGPLGIHNLCYINDTLLVSASNGLFVQHNNEFHRFALDGAPGAEVYRILADGTPGGFFLLGKNWLGQWKDDTLHVLNHSIDATINRRSNLLFDGMGNLLFNSEKHFYRFRLKDELLETFKVDEADAAPLNSVMFVDHERNLWIGTYRGAFKINSFRFANLGSTSGLLEDEGTVIAELDADTYFLGGTYSYVIKKGNAFTSHDLNLPDNYTTRLLDLARDPRSNRFYVAASNVGLGTFSNGKVTWSSPLASANAVTFYGEQLLVAGDRALYKYSDNNDPELVQSNLYVRQMASLPNRLVALATHAGLILTDLQTPRTLKHKDHQGSDLYAILPDEEQLLIGSAAGLLTIEDDSLIDLKYRGLKIKEPVYDLMKRRNGDVWIGTNDGVYVVKGKDILHYNTTDGLSGNEVNRNSMMEDSHGRVWIGTSGGISIYNDQYDSLYEIQPITEIIKIVTKDGTHTPDQELSLAHDNNDVEFLYRAVSFKNESKIRYRYRLLGYDTSWTITDNPLQRSVRYTSLPASKEYQFEFQASVTGHPWTSSKFSENISIRTPVYMAWWFILICVMMIFLMAQFINSYIYQTRYNKKLMATVDKKTREIELSKNMLELQNEALRDEINERRKIEEDRIELIHELQKTNKELDRFVYSASHDLSAPLKSLSGLLRVAELEEPGEKEYLLLMKKSIGRLEKFIQELIDFSRNARLEVARDPVNMDELIMSVIDSYHYLGNATSIEITVDVQNKNGNVFSDSFRLKTILNNLISNAINFYDSAKSDPMIHVRSWDSDNSFFIEVADNGVGIPEDHIGSIFEMFYRATEDSRGSGLGLYIVKETVDRLNGTITVTSEQGKGTTFLLRIPS